MIKRLIRRLDEQFLDGRFRRWWLRNMVLGGGWGEFLDAVEAIPDNAWVLDLGAGEAELKRRTSPRARYIALDNAMGYGQWDYSNLDVVADALRCPFRDGGFDVILCKQVLEHVPDPVALMREASRLLRPGGWLLLSTNQSWPQHQQPHDFFRFTSFALRYCADQAHLEVDRLLPMGGAFTSALFHGSQTISPHLWARSDAGRRVVSLLTRPVRLLLKASMPLVSLLDRLDTTKDNTLGWYLWASKSSEVAAKEADA